MRAVQILGAALVVFALTAVPQPARAGINYVYLTINLSGTGSGSWKSLTGAGGSPDGLIDCRMVLGVIDPREVCTQQFDGGDDGEIRIYFTVAPAIGTCLKVGTACNLGHSSYIDVGGTTTTNVKLDLASHTVQLFTDGTGAGSTTSSPAGISCSKFCSGVFGYGASVTLTATPAAGSVLNGWLGACSANGAQCVVHVTGDRLVNVRFDIGAAPTPSATAGASPSATPRATATAKPPSTPKPPTPTPTPPLASTAVGGSTGAPTLDPNPSVSPPPAASSPAASLSVGASVAPTTSPVDPAVAGSDSELTPIVLAILGAGLFIAIAIGLVGFGLMRRARGGSGAPPPA